MNNEFDDLKTKWQQAKTSPPTGSSKDLVKRANLRKRSNLYFHYGNVAILSLVMIVICLFFYYITPFQELLSKIGVVLMVGGLAIRIGIEIYSATKSKRIDYANPAAQTTTYLLEFYRFRKKIHGIPTVTIVLLYTLGFYMLTPEFSKYLSIGTMILIDGSYILGAVFLIWQIRKGLHKEMKNLEEVLLLHQDLTEVKDSQMTPKDLG